MAVTFLPRMGRRLSTKRGAGAEELRYNELRANPEIDVDGRNNIYTLHAAQYWDSKLCQRALEYGPDEVVMRLAGKVPKVERLGDGVYIVLNDDPAMSYDDFLSLNERCKEMLGLK